MIKLSKLSIILGGISIGLISSSATFLSMFLTKAIDATYDLLCEIFEAIKSWFRGLANGVDPKGGTNECFRL